MDKVELKKKLSNGEQWGFIKETDDREYLGWILINKLQKLSFTPQREDYLDEDLYQIKVREAEKREKTPYHVIIKELRRDVHEIGKYETGDDIRQKDNYYFSCIDEVEKFINELGYSFDNIKHRSEIDAP
ncbi:hypothetical protein H6G76_02640 [Nostoc sp. FACHB-152]|uniref:hypothetical protein n=1 Tax=unclassified Nostoc TaxID=2593658 RepID=UPI0016899723|nr:MULTISPECIES: hypothetical protein [unclassified Nostoc]MBD2446070.1 hypothetical protein [Nostoc sp. FACHB-152]MBD2467302.1 hypothetical protein [Nostoc sp. FACHB-145]